MTRFCASLAAVAVLLFTAAALPQDPLVKGKSMKEWAQKARDTNPYVRMKVAYSLFTVIGDVGPKNAKELVPVLKEMLADDDEVVRRNAARAVFRLGSVGKEL